MAKVKKLIKLKPEHYDAMKMRLNGLSIEEVALHLNKSVDTIKSWYYASDLFRQEWNALLEEQKERSKHILMSAGPDAAETMKEALGGNKHPTALTAAKDILDRIGLKPTDKVELNGEVKNTHTFDEKLLEDEEAVDALKKLFHKMKDDE